VCSTSWPQHASLMFAKPVNVRENVSDVQAVFDTRTG
jgi:hypothetical protein